MAVSAVYRTLWRQKAFILLMTAALVGTVYVVTARQTKLYTASALVRVEQKVTQANDVYGALITGERLARTYAVIAETESIRSIVRSRLPPSIPDDQIGVSASQVSTLELIRLAVTNSDPRLAARIANAFPGALSSFVERNGAPREIITTVERAKTPSAASSPNLRLNLILAVLLGLILSSALALLLEAFSDRVGSVEDLENLTGYPVIATIPSLRFVPSVQDLPDEPTQRQVERHERKRRPTAVSLRAMPDARPASAAPWQRSEHE